MCIIAAKPAGVNMPSYDTLRTMWNANNDGCGFMYVENGQVRIEKGFMKYKNFTKSGALSYLPIANSTLVGIEVYANLDYGQTALAEL